MKPEGRFQKDNREKLPYVQYVEKKKAHLRILSVMICPIKKKKIYFRQKVRKRLALWPLGA